MENRNRKSLTQPDTIAFGKGTVFAIKNSVISIKETLVLKDIFSKTTYVCVLT